MLGLPGENAVIVPPTGKTLLLHGTRSLSGRNEEPKSHRLIIHAAVKPIVRVPDDTVADTLSMALINDRQKYFPPYNPDLNCKSHGGTIGATLTGTVGEMPFLQVRLA